MQHSTSTRKYSFGLSRFGGGPVTLILVSLAAGLLTAVPIGALAVWLTPTAERAPLLLFATVTVATLGPASAGWWAVLVDRSTLRGATPRPEESVEGQWLQRAMASSLGICFAVAGLGAGFFAMTRWQVPVDVVLLALCGVIMASVVGHYLAIRAKES